ncbi:hypothetical protein OUZ56_014785 [Daphnia magna]|uniref:Carbonic anhydrase n=2 Tax=Daphnia magna TaxID=35525 RepID=A0ABR0AL15_9CRUS|nr:hypothetical protein OUZ56_014785 [Daphnia magna]
MIEVKAIRSPHLEFKFYPNNEKRSLSLLCKELQGSIVLNDGGQRQSSTNITMIRDNQSSHSMAGFQKNESGVPENSLFEGYGGLFEGFGGITKLPSQSPIDIITDEAIDADYASFHFRNYEKIFPQSLKNTGETVKLKIETEDLDKDNLPFISGGGLSGRYKFEQLHFHWGEGSRGSEHRIDGKQYAAELHIVHYNSKYENFIEASGEKGGLVVLAILIKLQARDNKVFRHLQQFEAIIDPTENDSDKLDVPFPLDDLLPDSTESFFRYNGSLTTPKFTEGVIWTVFDTPIAISKGQLAKFRLLLDMQGNRIKENARDVQDVNDREIFYRAEQNADDNDLPDDDERLSRDP